jgi:hypothetical protein
VVLAWATVVLAWATVELVACAVLVVMLVVSVVVPVAVLVVLPGLEVVVPVCRVVDWLEGTDVVVLVVANALCMPAPPKAATTQTRQPASRRPLPCLKTRPKPGPRHTLNPSPSDNALFQRIAHPWDDLVKHVFERGSRLETKHALGFFYGWDPLGDVMFEGRVADVMEGHF